LAHMIETEKLSPQERAEIRRLLDQGSTGTSVGPRPGKKKGETP
jgi:hypothetical protein